MPWTLYRYILRELLKLLVLTTVVLVTVISFAAAIKPMSEGILGPVAMVKFIGYSAPTMLGFALPFAGAFAATLIFIRMATDNEILACSASGISYRAILLPVALLGLSLTMGLFYLSNYVVPSFYRAAAETVETDLMTVLVSQLNQNRPFDRFENMVLSADNAVERPAPHLPDSPIQPSKLIELEGVAVGQLDDQAKLRSDVTAQRTNVLLFREQSQSWITIRLREVMFYDPLRGQLGYTELYDVPPVRLPNPFKDSPKFFSWPQLRELSKEPDRFHEVRKLTLNLAKAVSAATLKMHIRQSLSGKDGGQVVLAGARPADQYIIRAPSVTVGEKGMLILHGKDNAALTVEYRSPNLPNRRLEARSATLHIEQVGSELEPSVRMQLDQVKVYDLHQPAQFSERTELTLPRMVWPESLLPARMQEAAEAGQLRAWDMLDVAGTERYERSKPVRVAARSLLDEITELAHKTIAQLHERAASAVACLLLLVLGAVLSMHLKGQMPLVVYFWSFLLAILTIILIHTGENMATSKFPLAVGLLVLWSGNILLAVTGGWVYCKLARN